MKRSPPIYDDEYQGPRFRYGLTYRPAPWGVPTGFIVGSGREHPDFRFGTIDYPFEIDPRVANQMDLTRVEQMNRPTSARSAK